MALAKVGPKSSERLKVGAGVVGESEGAKVCSPQIILSVWTVPSGRQHNGAPAKSVTLLFRISPASNNNLFKFHPGVSSLR